MNFKYILWYMVVTSNTVEFLYNEFAKSLKKDLLYKNFAI